VGGLLWSERSLAQYHLQEDSGRRIASRTKFRGQSENPAIFAALGVFSQSVRLCELVRDE